MSNMNEHHTEFQSAKHYFHTSRPIIVSELLRQEETWTCLKYEINRILMFH